MTSEKALRAAAKEMNEVMDGLDPPIRVKASVAILTEDIRAAITKIEEDDEFSEATQVVIDELKPKKAKKGKVEEDVDEDPDDAEDDAADDDDDNDDAEEGSELRTEVEEAEKLSELKTLAKENDEFKTIRAELSAYKDVEELREDMIDLLDQETEEVEEVVEKLHKKNVGDKKTSTSKKVKDEEEEDEDAPEEEEDPTQKKKRAGGPPKGVKPNFQKEGSMALFMDETAKAGGSWEDIFATVSKEAKKRGIKTTLSTIKAHIRFRVSKDAKFLGKKKVTEDGIE